MNEPLSIGRVFYYFVGSICPVAGVLCINSTDFYVAIDDTRKLNLIL